MIRQSLVVVGLVLLGALVAGCFHENPAPGNGNNQPPTEDALDVSLTAPEQASPNQPFTVSVTVTTTKSLPAISLRADFDGLTLVDRGDFMSADGNVVQAAIIQPAAGDEQTLEFEVECTENVQYAVTGIAQSRNITPVWSTVNIQCGN